MILLFLPNPLLVAAALLLTSSDCCVICTGCNVDVDLVQSASRTFIPEGATVEINCTAESSQFPVWSIQLPGRTGLPLQFPVGNSRMTLNDRGFYELQEVDLGGTRVIRLLINNTMGTNGSDVGCVDTSSGNAIGQTTLHTYVPTPLTIKSMDIEIHSINVSWSFMDMTSSLISQDVNWTYSLTVSTDSTLISTLQLNDSHYVFSSRGSPSPCEVYNFSVTATPVGATYTGDGCSVPSPTFSTMLPSLPDISKLESSLNYSLTKVVKNEDAAIILMATFMPADYCESYPVTNYTLDFTQSSVPDSLMLTATENSVSLTAHNLVENTVYKIRIVVSNSVGSVSTSEETIYTTDLQSVVAVQTDSDSISVQCVFITGSDAQGCMVVLESEVDNITITLSVEKQDTCTVGTINTTRSLDDYSKLSGFDIESNGSIGTLPVPGELMVNSTNIIMTLCMAEQPSATASRPLWIIGVVLALVLTLVVLLVTVVVYVRRKKSHYNIMSSTSRPTESQSPADHHTYIGVAHDQSSQVRSMGTDNEKEDPDREFQASMPVYDAPESSSGH